MKTIKIIDLLNKIANGEEVPKQIKYMDTIYTFDECYEDNWKYSVKRNGTTIGLLEDSLYYKLNDEVKIIEEEKEISKITMRAGLVGSVENKIVNLDINIMAVEDKINELIEAVNEMRANNE